MTDAVDNKDSKGEKPFFRPNQTQTIGVVLNKQSQVFASVGAGDRSLDRALNDFGFGKAKTVAFVGKDRSPHFHTLPTKYREDPKLTTTLH